MYNFHKKSVEILLDESYNGATSNILAWVLDQFSREGGYMNLTALGVELRKLRLDLGMTLYDMAQKLCVSSSLLSSVETGKKPATTGFMDKLLAEFEEVRHRKAEFMKLAEVTKTDVKIRLDHENAQAKDVALAFARNFDKLNAQQLEQIMLVFTQGNKGK